MEVSMLRLTWLTVAQHVFQPALTSWQVGLSWFREKLSPANREQRLLRSADFAKNCLPRIGSKELPRFREKYRALGRQKMGSNMRPQYIQFRDIRDRDISGLHCNSNYTDMASLKQIVTKYLISIRIRYQVNQKKKRIWIWDIDKKEFWYSGKKIKSGTFISTGSF